MKYKISAWFAMAVAIACNAVLMPGTARALSGTTFVNGMYGTNDPCITKGPDGAYYLVQATSSGDGSGKNVIVVWKSPGLTHRGTPQVVWTSPGGSAWNSMSVWAPEIQYINNKWYIYYAASDGTGNYKHRMGVLEADTSDPQGSYTDHGRVIPAVVDDHWQIDGTVLQKSDGSLYMVWSGWPTTSNTNTQRLYIASMSSPLAVNSARVQLAAAIYSWEQVGMPIAEGPEILKNGSKTFIVYSASGSWTADYCYGMLTNTDGNYLNPGSWSRSPTAVFSKNVSGGVYGPGHGSFTTSKDGTEQWMMYHSSLDSGGSWNRVANIKEFTWDINGDPDFGTPPAWGAVLTKPSGEPANGTGGTFFDSFDSDNNNWALVGSANGDDLVATGYWSTIRRNTSTNILIVDGSGDERHGEKAYIRGKDWTDFTLETDINIANEADGNFGGGVFFRATNIGTNFYRFNGYGVVLNTQTQKVSLGYANATTNSWTVIQSQSATINWNQWYHLKVIANGSTIQVFFGDMTTPLINTTDTHYSVGAIGVRGINSRTLIDNFSVTP